MCLAAAHSFLPLFLKGVVWRWHQRDDRECTILTKHPLSFHRHLNQLWHLDPACQMTGHRSPYSFFVPVVCFFSWRWIHWAGKWKWRWRSPPAPTARVAKWTEREWRQGLWTWWMNGQQVNRKSASYLPEEEEAEHNFDGSQPDSIEIHHKIHQLLSVCRNQIHDLAHGASPPSSAVYHQWLYPKQKKKA